MKIPKENRQHPLEERIGSPDLLVGREKEFAKYHKWIFRVKTEGGFEQSTVCRLFKMEASDGKKRNTDCAKNE